MSVPSPDFKTQQVDRPPDERLWPIQIALCVWAVLLAGAVWELGGFTDPRLLENGWTRLIALGLTLAALIWATRTVYPERARRLKLAVVVSLAAHTLLVIVLYRHHLEYHLKPLDFEHPIANDSPDIKPPVDKFLVKYQSDAPGREAFELPIATNSPSSERIELPRHAELPIFDNATLPPDEARQLPASQPTRLRRRQDALARAARTRAKLSRRKPTAASVLEAAAVELPQQTDNSQSASAAHPALQPPAIPTPRTAAPQLAPQVIVSVPELPSARVTQELPRQRTADALPTIALDLSRARSRRRVEAAPLPEMPSETERPADRTTTYATRPIDAQAQSQDRATDSADPNAAASAGVVDPDTTRYTNTAKDGLARTVTTVPAGPPLEAGSPDTQSSGRLSTQTLRRRRSADADPGLRSGGGLDRPRRSRGPSPAAPVLAPLPAFATSREQESEDPEANRPPSPVIVEAPAERGGLGNLPANDSGLVDRLAARDSNLIHLSPADRINRRAGGEGAAGRPIRQPAAAYSIHAQRSRAANDAGSGGPSNKTEAAVELGLAFLARVQLEDGRWEFQYLGEEADPRETEQIIIEADAAATGLALLAFLGAGHDHFGSQHDRVVQNGLDYLVRIQNPSGELFPEHDQPVGQVTRFYGHGIATRALCEAYGMTGDPGIKRPAQAAIDYLIATQHSKLGGWRYVPGSNADLSVSGWQLVALKSGDLAGLTIRADVYERLRAFLERCREEDGEQARFRYNPWASPSDPRTRHGLQPSTVMTSVGMLMQLNLDEGASDQRLERGADHLLANLPQLGGAAIVAPTGTIGNPQRDSYYWYYASQVMYRLGGPYWQAWNDRLHPLLVTSQTTAGPLAGSWDPHRPVPDKWANYGGRLYVTALNLLSLEVQYRHLPLDKQSPTRIADRPD